MRGPPLFRRRRPLPRLGLVWTPLRRPRQPLRPVRGRRRRRVAGARAGASAAVAPTGGVLTACEPSRRHKGQGGADRRRRGGRYQLSTADVRLGTVAVAQPAPFRLPAAQAAARHRRRVCGWG